MQGLPTFFFFFSYNIFPPWCNTYCDRYKKSVILKRLIARVFQFCIYKNARGFDFVYLFVYNNYIIYSDNFFLFLFVST